MQLAANFGVKLDQQGPTGQRRVRWRHVLRKPRAPPGALFRGRGPPVPQAWGSTRSVRPSTPDTVTA